MQKPGQVDRKIFQGDMGSICINISGVCCRAVNEPSQSFTVPYWPSQARYKLNPTGFPIYPTTFRQVLEGISPIFPTATEGISDYKLYFLSINDIKDKVHVYIFIS